MESGSLDILLADDNHDAVDTLAMLMRLWGHNVSAAYDGGEALALASERRFDAALLDLDMPGTDGLTLAQALHAEVPLLWAMSGYADELHRQRCLDTGFDLILVKPIDLIRLQKLLAEAARMVAQAK